MAGDSIPFVSYFTLITSTDALLEKQPVRSFNNPVSTHVLPLEDSCLVVFAVLLIQKNSIRLTRVNKVILTELEIELLLSI